MSPARSPSLPHELARRTAPWLERLARFGHVAKGVVYGGIGTFALRAAWSGGPVEGGRGVLARIAAQPFGSVLLALVVLGLASYSGWRFIEAWKGDRRAESGWKRAVERIGFAASGLAYLSLAVYGASFFARSLKSADGGDQGRVRDATAELMSHPFGRWLVAGAGALLVGIGAFHLRKALSGRFLSDYRREEMGPGARRLALWSGRVGIASRSLVFFVMGGFLVHAAWSFDPSEAKGLRDALDALAGAPYGPWILAAVAAGFLAYALHCFTRARYRRLG